MRGFFLSLQISIFNILKREANLLYVGKERRFKKSGK
jgi:hypothetical protein